jgi:3-hydroxyacyl-[acyl-carrier-protein] dehydratase
MRFLLVDSIVSCEPGQSIQARKLTSRFEAYCQPGDPKPAVPDPLVLESLCQAGAWLVFVSTEHRKRAALLSIGAVQFHGPAYAGETLELAGAVEAMGDETAVLSGTVTAAGRLVLEANEIMCALINAEDLEDPAETVRNLRAVQRAGGST